MTLNKSLYDNGALLKQRNYYRALCNYSTLCRDYVQRGVSVGSWITA